MKKLNSYVETSALGQGEELNNIKLREVEAENLITADL